MNNTTLINTNSHSNNIVYIKTEHCQIMATTIYRILKSEPMIKKAIVSNQFLRLNQFYHNAGFIRPNFHQFQIDYHQDNLSVAHLQFYQRNCLDILAGNTCFYKEVKNQ